MHDLEAPIGIFDSGIGGLTVAKAVSDLLPAENLLYFGDTAHMPYGEKSSSAIQAYSIKICNLFLNRKVKAILIACNSASTAAFDLVKEYVGSKAQVFNVIDPMVAYVAQHYPQQKVGLIGTKQTVGSNVYQKKLDATNTGVQLQALATPLLAPMIEEGFFQNNISASVVANYLESESLAGITSLILGCTHYPLIKTEIEKFYNNSVTVLDSSQTVALAMKEQLEALNLLQTNLGQQGAYHFYVSDYTRSFEASTRIFFGKEVVLEHYPLWD
jgi:glutamate racemase